MDHHRTDHSFDRRVNVLGRGVVLGLRSSEDKRSSSTLHRPSPLSVFQGCSRLIMLGPPYLKKYQEFAIHQGMLIRHLL